MASVWTELRRRNVVKVAVAYAIVGWLLVEVASVVLPTFKAPEWIMQVFTFLVIVGFPLALIFAWAFEITPEGIKREKDVDRSQSITHLTGRNIDYIIIAALSVALLFFAFTHDWGGEEVKDSVGTADKSIAVLPFSNRSSEQENAQFLADGIHDELLTLLANLNSLTVISRTSVMKYRDTIKNMKTIGEELGVATILEGGVQRAGNQIRINVQLIDANTDKHIWAKIYDRTLTTETIFAIQSEIATSIAEQLEATLSPEDQKTLNKRPTQNLDAYNAYLRGRHLVVQRTRATIQGAVREFEKAIALDPDYAVAHAELALAIGLQGSRGYGALTTTERIARGAPHAERAMALDPTLAEAHAAAGFLLAAIQGNYEEAVTHFRRAIQINPNYSIVYTWIANNLDDNLGRYDEAFAMEEAALRLDPLSIPAIGNYVLAMLERNRLDEAGRELEKLASIAPGIYAEYRGVLTSLDGKWANAVMGNLDALQINPRSIAYQNELARQFAVIGLGKEALAISESPPPVVQRLLGRSEDAVTTAEARLAEDPDSLRDLRNLGLALASAGDYARAWPILEDIWKRSGGRITHGRFRIADAAALIDIRRDAGEEANVAEILAAIMDNVRRYREAGAIKYNLISAYSADYEEGLATYLVGSHETGLALIAKAAEEGYFIMPTEAYLQSLYDDPGFAPIRASQEARQARERDRFLAIVCTDNPYAAVWQPEEGTCERFAATAGN